MSKRLIAGLFMITLIACSFIQPEKGKKDGKKLFMENCFPCHGPYKGIVGPPFQRIRKDYEMDWIMSMVHNHDSMAWSKDNRASYSGIVWEHAGNRKTIELSKDEVTAILDYVDTFPFDKGSYLHRKFSDKERNDLIDLFEKNLAIDFDRGRNVLDSLRKF